MNYSEIRGFNYQPSYGSTGYELWRQFDAAVVARELGLGKQYFPGINAIRYTMGELKKRGIGWLVYLLHWSRIADAHGPDGGPVGAPGNLSFINQDGSLRAGHEVFSQF